MKITILICLLIGLAFADDVTVEPPADADVAVVPVMTAAPAEDSVTVENIAATEGQDPGVPAGAEDESTADSDVAAAGVPVIGTNVTSVPSTEAVVADADAVAVGTEAVEEEMPEAVADVTTQAETVAKTEEPPAPTMQDAVTAESPADADVAVVPVMTAAPAEDSVTEENIATTEGQEPGVTAGVEDESTADSEVAATGVPVIDTNVTSVASTEAVVADADNVTVGTEAVEEETTEAVADVTTQAETAATTEEPPAPTTQEPCEPADSPCCTATILEEEGRHITQTAANEDSYICDKELKAGWYGFRYQGERARIPSDCIKPGQCSTQLAYHLEFRGVKVPTEVGDTVNATLLTAAEIAGQMECDNMGEMVTVMACEGGYQVYQLAKGLRRCNSAICTQLINETTPYDVLAMPPVTEAPETTEPPTEEPRMPLNSIAQEDMEPSDYEGVVTIEYTFNETLNNEFLAAFDAYFRAALAKKLTELAPNETEADDVTEASKEEKPTEQPEELVTILLREGDDSMNEKAPEKVQKGPKIEDIDPDADGIGPILRKRRDADTTAAAGAAEEEDAYVADDVYYMEPTPRDQDGKLQVAVVVKEKDGSAVPADRIIEALDAMNEDGSLEKGSDAPVIGYYAGVPKDLRPNEGASTDNRPDIWESHMGLFIAVIILCGICLIVIIIGLLCIKCRGSGSWDPKSDKAPIAMEEGKKKPPSTMVIENPLPDEEITRDEAPMVERANPSVSPNGSGQHLKKEEDNGWVVPLDQLTDAERAEPDVANTKL